MMKEVKVLFFDLDNTLWDHRKAQEAAITRLSQKYGLPAKEFNTIYARNNLACWKKFARGEYTLQEMRYVRFAQSLEEIGRPELCPQTLGEEYLEIYKADCFLMPGAEETVSRLSGHYRLGIITNGFRDTQKGKIDRCSIGKSISYFISVEDVGVLKPDPKFFQFALDKAGVTKGQAIYIGDSYEDDVLGAKEFGLRVIWFNHDGKQTLPDVDTQPDVIIHNLSELIPLFIP